MKERKVKILTYLFEVYSQTNKPVSSSQLTKKINLSASMLRYELQDLEKEGFIQKENFSSGRIPTDKGIKFVIDFNKNKGELMNNDDDPMSALKKQLTVIFENRSKEIDNVLSEAFDLLNKFTKTITLKENNNQNAKIVDVKYYLIDENNVSLILVLSDGSVHNQIYRSTEEDKKIKNSINLISHYLINKNILEVLDYLPEVFKQTNDKMKDFEISILETIKNLIDHIIENSKSNKISQNSLINFLESNQNINLLKELIKKVQTESIWEIFDSNPIRYDENTLISLNPKNKSFGENSLVERKFDFNGNEHKFYFIGNKNQNFTNLIDLLNFIDKKISKI